MLRCVTFAICDQSQEMNCGNSAHFIEWLANCGEAGPDGCSAGNVIESHYRHLMRNVKSSLVERGDGADRGCVIETENC